MTTSDQVSAVKTAATINLLAGIWLFLSPWVYRGSSESSAWNSWIIGAIIVALAATRIANPLGARLASIVNMLLGIWTLASVWVFRDVGNIRRFVTSLCVGAIVFSLGAFESSMGRTTTAPPARRT